MLDLNITLDEYESFFNSRARTSPPPKIAREFIPETAESRPLPWLLVDKDKVSVFSDNGQVGSSSQVVLAVTKDDEHIYVPIHPIERELYKEDEIHEIGLMRPSASYRTIFFSMIADQELKLDPGPNMQFMIKLHLENPLPGILGDRRLPRERVERCVSISKELEKLRREGRLSPVLKILREEVGLVFRDRGAIFRRAPVRGVLPGFALFSKDRRNQETPPMVVWWLRDHQKLSPRDAAISFGDLWAKPMVDALFSAMREGFALEMHPQNTLFILGKDCAIDAVIYRDFEGVIFSNTFRRRQGLAEKFVNLSNREIHEHDREFGKFFNRNLDFDLGRFWSNLLDALALSGYFKQDHLKIAIASIRQAVRKSLKEHELESLGFWGRWLRLSRSPYGKWYQRSHYYRSRFR